MLIWRNICCVFFRNFIFFAFFVCLFREKIVRFVCVYLTNADL